MTVTTIPQDATDQDQPTNLAAALAELDCLVRDELAAAQPGFLDDPETTGPIDRDALLDRILQLEYAEPWWSPLEGLGLSPLERLIVLLALAPEVSLRTEHEYSLLNGDTTRRLPTVDLALRLLGTDGEAARRVRGLLTEGSRLTSLGIVQTIALPSPGSSLADGLTLSRLVVSMLLDWAGGPSLPAHVVLHRPGLGRSVVDDDLTERLRSATSGSWLGLGSPLVFVRAPRTDLARAAALRVGAVEQRRVLEVDLSSTTFDELADTVRTTMLLRLLHGAVTVVVGLADEHALPVVAGLSANQPGWEPGPPVLVHLAGNADVPPRARAVGITVRLDPPSTAKRTRTWHATLADHGLAISGQELETLSSRFDLEPTEIAHVVRSAQVLAPDGRPGFDHLARAAGQSSTGSLLDLAVHVPAGPTWADLVVQPSTVDELHHLAATVRHRHQVAAWGVGSRQGGAGLAAVFAGSSGTGKTLAASILAADLSLELFRVDPATVVSKYIGETEKNLDQVFTAAERCGAMLLFDEADALFGRRSETRSAHDRYANLETAYLLQRIEAHRGVVILTTNLRHHIDEAFLRRFAAIVEFAEPGELERRRLWDLLLGSSLDRADDVDIARLAQEQILTGGEIATIAVDAATLAAASGRELRSADIAAAIARLHRRHGR